MTKLSVGPREARKKLQHATKSRRFYKEGDNSRERVMLNRSKSIQELKKVTTCDRCGALGHWEDECPLKGHRRRSSPGDRSSGSGRIRKQSGSRKRLPRGQGKGKGKARRVKFEEALPIEQVYRHPEERISNECSARLARPVLHCRTAKSFAGAERAAILARNVVATQEIIARLRLTVAVESENR